MNKANSVLALMLVWGLLLPAAALALDNGASWFDWEYRLDEPGARGRGMGGATVAVTNDATTAAIFDGGEDVHHATFGLGIPLGSRNQIDIAIDLADDNRHQGLLAWRWRL